MPQFADLPLAILRSISAASGETYLDVEQADIEAGLRERGFDFTPRQLNAVMSQLRDAGYVDATRSDGWVLVRLAERGRQEVEGWPAAPGSLSKSDVEQLLAGFEQRSEDATLTPDERSRAKAAADALRTVGPSVVSGLVVGWLQSLGIR